MHNDLKESGIVTALSVVGFIFGLIGMMCSFIPFIGSLAFYIGIPAAIISLISVIIAVNQNAKRTFAVVALTISLLGVAISGFQYHTIKAMGQKAKKELQKMNTPKPIPKPEDDVIPAKVYSPTSESKSSEQK